MKTVQNEVGTKTWMSWPTGATIAIEGLESFIQDIKHKVIRVKDTGNGTYLDEIIESIDRDTD
jgi:hypothetical protein